MARNLTPRLQQAYIYIADQASPKGFEFNQASPEEFYISTHCTRESWEYPYTHCTSIAGSTLVVTASE